MRYFVVVLSGIASLCSINSSQAQLTFSESFNGTNGANPQAVLTISGNTLCGTTSNGGTYSDGTVFSLPATGGTPTTLANFNGTNGTTPDGGLTLFGSTLYGTTEKGGISGDGTVFSLPVTGGIPTTLANFGYDVSQNNGDHPIGCLTLVGSTLYGATTLGGVLGEGNVFSVPFPGGIPTTLTTFAYPDGAVNNLPNGEYPHGGLILVGNTLYGTTELGGTYNDGTVFSVPAAGGPTTTLANFNYSGAGNQGRYPLGTLAVSGNTLYGTTMQGGGGYGTVFSLPITGGTPTTLVSFNGTDGAGPLAGVTISGTTIYGTTTSGGNNNYGAVFSVPITGGTPTTLVYFNGTNGANPEAELLISGNMLYGTTSNGGANGDGTVFGIALESQEDQTTDTPTMSPWGLAILGLLLIFVAAKCLPVRQVLH